MLEYAHPRPRRFASRRHDPEVALLCALGATPLGVSVGYALNFISPLHGLARCLSGLGVVLALSGMAMFFAHREHAITDDRLRSRGAAGIATLLALVQIVLAVMVGAALLLWEFA